MEYTDQNQLDDFKWFVSHYNTLFQKYGHKFLVIRNQVVLGVYDNHSLALHETLKNRKIGTFIIQECNGSESGYTNYIASNEVHVI